MAYHLDLSEQIRLGMVDPDEPGDKLAEWAFEVGHDDGYARGLSHEGLEALSAARGDYLEGYSEGFRFRKEQGLSNRSYGASLEGAGEMFMPRDHDHYGWTDVYRRAS